MRGHFFSTLQKGDGQPATAVVVVVGRAIRIMTRHRAADHRTTQPGRSCLGPIIGASEHQRCNY